MSAAEPDITLIICTHNRAGTLSRVLEEVVLQEGIAKDRWEVLVVDNDSTDDTRAAVDRWIASDAPRVRYVLEPERGKSGALNRGIHEARGKILAFTDDDVRIPPTWLAALVAPFDDPACMGVAGAVRPSWDRPPPAWVCGEEPYRMMAALVQYWQGPDPGPALNAPIGANCAWRREVFERHGGYRTELGPAGAGSVLGEDTELGLRMLARGERVWYSPAALLLHPVPQDRLTKSYFLEWYYHSGRAEAFRDAPTSAVYLAGVPRYLIRELLEMGSRWLMAIAPTRRFFYKLRTYQTFGRIRGFRTRAAAGGSG